MSSVSFWPRGPKELSPRGCHLDNSINGSGVEHPIGGPTASRLKHVQAIVEAQGTLQRPLNGRVLIAGMKPKAFLFGTLCCISIVVCLGQ